MTTKGNGKTIKWIRDHQIPRLPALAARLGVEPNTRSGESGRTLLHMKNGDKYDLFDLMNAFLDRVDAASPTDQQ